MTERNTLTHPVVIGALRWSMVIIFAFFGTAKFAAYEAQGVAGIAGKHPLFAWMYPIWGDAGASAIIGCIELLTGALIAAGAFHSRAGLVGGAMGVFTFCVTLSFAPGAPAFWQEGYGIPFLGSTGQFLLKDAGLLAACLAIAVDGHDRSIARRPRAR
ncbi:YkgB family protein [Novosphingobium aquimarinum]|uniref:YkgB family protein n=1 Tax=Novosphingobium aquimarinum TaxID=2682494 RepID=UPI0018DE4B9F|nr:DUF417 family protein [Novosphingobium aquimarinum]